jgi:hypothetical protein
MPVRSRRHVRISDSAGLPTGSNVTRIERRPGEGAGTVHGLACLQALDIAHRGLVLVRPERA